MVPGTDFWADFCEVFSRVEEPSGELTTVLENLSSKCLLALCEVDDLQALLPLQVPAPRGSSRREGRAIMRFRRIFAAAAVGAELKGARGFLHLGPISGASTGQHGAYVSRIGSTRQPSALPGLEVRPSATRR